MTHITFPLLIFGALGDSINPCAIAVLIFLITFLRSLKKKGKSFLAIGFTYIVFVYITYFLAGLGLLTVVKGLGISKIVYIVTAIVVILAGFIDIKDFFWYGKGITLGIPASKKPIIKKYIAQASVPAAIILGVLVSLFELPCTGGIYFAIIGLLSEQTTKIQGILYLLLYNVIFVLPLVIILTVAYSSISSDKLNTWREKNKRLMKLFLGLFMVLLGLLMFLWV
jgi:cytochrome c biogenesis protein CcdA